MRMMRVGKEREKKKVTQIVSSSSLGSNSQNLSSDG